MYSMSIVFVDRSVVNVATAGLLWVNKLVNLCFITSKKSYT